MLTSNNSKIFILSYTVGFEEASSTMLRATPSYTQPGATQGTLRLQKAILGGQHAALGIKFRALHIHIMCFKPFELYP